MLVPFSLRLTPPLRLVLVTLRDDDTYTDLEVQWVRDASGAEGMVLLAVRSGQGSTDLYVQSHLSLDHDDYQVGGGLASFTAAQFEPSVFDLTAAGVRLHLGVPLLDGRTLRLDVVEARRRPRLQVDMLAPAGQSMLEPRAFPLFWMHDIWFLRWRGAQVRAEIGGQPRRLVRLGAPWRLARYASHPLTGLLCSDHRGPVSTVPDEPGRVGLETSSVRVVPGPAIERITAERDGQGLAVRFDPPVPDLASLPDTRLEGRFGLWAAEREQVGGTYRVQRSGDEVRLALDVDRPWDPGPQPWQAAAVFRALTVFRTWPTTYRWRATVDLTADPPVIDGGWQRTSRRP